jgi:hypothetical protein
MVEALRLINGQQALIDEQSALINKLSVELHDTVETSKVWSQLIDSADERATRWQKLASVDDPRQPRVVARC